MSLNILNLFLSIPALLIAFTVREYTRARVADSLGDKTPRFQKRLTLDPLAHIDPVGFIAMLLFNFGWSKPVQINKSAFKRYRKDSLKVNISAWLSNLIVAVVVAIIYALFIKLFGRVNSDIISIITIILRYIIIFNVNLFVFNILPLPGLDGFRILEDYSPKTFYKISETIYQYYTIILILVIVAGGRILYIPTNFIMNILETLIKIII